jgi:hypothetical protein
MGTRTKKWRPRISRCSFSERWQRRMAGDTSPVHYPAMLLLDVPNRVWQRHCHEAKGCFEFALIREDHRLRDARC